MAKPGKKAGKKAGKKVRVEFRSNRNRPSRQKDWTRRHRDGEEIDSRAVEHVIAKGDLSRKRTVTEGAAEGAALSGGTVVALRGQFAQVDDGTRIWPCTVRRLLRTRATEERFPVTVGDRVGFRVVADGEGVQTEGVIERVESRRSELKRVANQRQHVIAANVDQVLIVSSADQPSPKPHLIDRYLVAASAGGMNALLCMNKIDLDESGKARQIADLYGSLGCPVLCTSAITGEGVEALRDVFRDKSTVLAGQSGVGKSSLLNALQPGLKLRVAEVSEDTAKGRHTTTTAELLRMEFGAYVVDTPGVRSFDISAIPIAELELHFAEFVPCVADCRFPDCTHRHEADCAIKNAVEAGDIHALRYESYVRMFEERLEA